MSRHQNQLVDNALEEGQFDMAISILEQLRSPEHKPATIHILHLLFIALHPTHETALSISSNAESSSALLDHANLVLQSPRKIIKAAKATLVLSPQTVNEARRLLASLVLTNTPGFLSPALPYYTGIKNPSPFAADTDLSGTPILNQSLGIKSARSCWEIIEEGYVTKASRFNLLASPKGKGKQGRARGSNLFGHEASFGDLSLSHDFGEEEEKGGVGEDSWFVLEWLINLFEKDAQLTEAKGEPRHSPLLVQQLPLPPVGTTFRWDTSEPVKIIFCCFRQTDPRRQDIGVQLLNLLIDLTYTPHLALHTFVSSIHGHIVSSTIHTTGDPLTPLISHLPSTTSILPFKISIYRKVLQDALEPCFSPFGSTLESCTRTKPQARKSQPRPLARASSTTSATTTVPNENTPVMNDVEPTAPESTIVNKTPIPAGPSIPSCADIVRLLQLPLDAATDGTNVPAWTSKSLLMRVKYELALACGKVLLHWKSRVGTPTTSATPHVGDWLRSIQDGTLAQVFGATFAPQGLGEREQADVNLYKILLGGVFASAAPSL